MAAFSISNFVKSAFDAFAALLDSGSTYKQGQWVKRATVVGVVKIQPATVTTDGHLVVGVAEFSDPPESQPGGPEEPRPLSAAVQHQGQFVFKGKTGETYKPWDNLVIDSAPADGQSLRLYDAGAGDSFADVVAIGSPELPAAGVTGASGFNLLSWIAPPALGRNNGVDTLVLL